MQKKVKVPQRYSYIAALLSMRCNLNCSYCNNILTGDFDRKKFKEISGEQWVKALNRLDSPEIPITFEGGEPFLHRDFVYIINHLDVALNIDILTNLYFGEKKLEEFIKKVEPERIQRNSPYPSIRTSYHPQQMKDTEKLIKGVKNLQERGFSIGIEGVMYPSDEHLTAIEQMAVECRNHKISFRPKSYIGVFDGKDEAEKLFSVTYGNFSRYPDSFNQQNTKSCLCRTSELIIGPNADAYRCHRDLYAQENTIGNLLDDNFQIQDIFRPCDKYGHCHPCDVKVKTNYKQQIGHTSVEIKNIQRT